MGEEKESILLEESLKYLPDTIVVCSAGRGPEVVNLLRGLVGDKVAVIAQNPDVLLSQQDLCDLGLMEEDGKGGFRQVYFPEPGKPGLPWYMYPWLLNPQEARPELRFKKSQGYPYSDIYDWGLDIAAVACSKLRTVVHRIAEARKRGATSISECYIARDTGQLCLDRMKNKLVYQTHPGPDLNLQKQAALQQVQAGLVSIVTAGVALTLFARIDTNERVARTVENIYTLRGYRKINEAFTSNSLTHEALSLVNLILLRFETDDGEKWVFSLPDECFANRPGGLKYEHPSIHWAMQVLVVKPGEIIIDLGKNTLPRNRRNFADWIEAETWCPYLELSENQRQAVQDVRSGLLPKEKMRQQLMTMIGFFARYPKLSRAVSLARQGIF